MVCVAPSSSRTRESRDVRGFAAEQEFEGRHFFYCRDESDMVRLVD